jgi:chemotaxis protein methyltransferase CheR
VSATAPVDPNHFLWVADFLYTEAGIVLTPEKSYLVQTRLTPLLRIFDLPDLALMFARLRSRTNPNLALAVVDAFTTNETSFFRDLHPFDTLAADILPAMVAKRESTRVLRIWSAACSTGQEPYTLGMLLRNHFPELRPWDVKILATDLCTNALSIAQAGLYRPNEVSRGLDERYVKRFFKPVGRKFQISSDIADLVHFERFNLVTQLRADGPFDIIFLRNVLIYFDEQTRNVVLSRMRDLLAPDGILMLGGSEAACQMPDGFATQRHERTTWHMRKSAT